MSLVGDTIKRCGVERVGQLIQQISDISSRTRAYRAVLDYLDEKGQDGETFLQTIKYQGEQSRARAYWLEMMEPRTDQRLEEIDRIEDEEEKRRALIEILAHLLQCDCEWGLHKVSRMIPCQEDKLLLMGVVKMPDRNKAFQIMDSIVSVFIKERKEDEIFDGLMGDSVLVLGICLLLHLSQLEDRERVERAISTIPTSLKESPLIQTLIPLVLSGEKLECDCLVNRTAKGDTRKALDDYCELRSMGMRVGLTLKRPGEVVHYALSMTDPVKRFEALRWLALDCCKKGSYDQALAYVEKLSDPVERSRLQQEIAFCVDGLDQAIQVARAIVNEEIRNDTILSLMHRRNVDRRLKLYPHLTDLKDKGIAVACLACELVAQGRAPEAVALVEEYALIEVQLAERGEFISFSSMELSKRTKSVHNVLRTLERVQGITDPNIRAGRIVRTLREHIPLA
ncbi:MAG: hypothetical protein KDK65_01570 [Chlamydiia bacterium]|nr:hypothetical protein [Chlamydiia bacterium]